MSFGRSVSGHIRDMSFGRNVSGLIRDMASGRSVSGLIRGGFLYLYTIMGLLGVVVV
jgi:hypothetical protein